MGVPDPTAAPKRPPREDAVVRAVLKLINTLPDGYARKTHGSRYAKDWPDIVGVIGGRAVMLECKRPRTSSRAAGYGVTTGQSRELGRWSDAGAVVGVVRSADEARDILNRAGLLDGMP